MRRTGLIIGLIAVVALGAGAFIAPRATRNQNSDNSNGYAVVNGTPADSSTPTSALPSTARTDVLTVSRAFSERYGSTSSEQPEAMLAAVQLFTTPALQQTLARLSKQQTPSPEPTVVSSRALAFSVRSLDEKAGRADVTVSLQRREQTGSKQAIVYTQDLGLQLIRQGPAWQVNFASWGNRQG